MSYGNRLGPLHREQQQPKERRNGVRKALRIRADVLISNQQVLPSHSVDISIGGIGLICTQSLPAGQEIRLRLSLSACGLERDIEIVGCVCFCLKVGTAQYRAGLRFVHLDDDTAGFIEALCG